MISRMKGAVLLALSLIVAGVPVHAGPLGLDFVPVGSGARALGMGGAFTSIADDATAAWWNPAGLSQLERPEASLVLQYRTFAGEVVDGSPPTTMTGEDTTTSVNFASIVYPLGGKSGGARKSISLSYGNTTDFNSSVSDGAGHYMKTQGGINNVTLAFSTELSANISVGISVIRYTGSFKYEWLVPGPSPAVSSDVDISGTGGAVGLLWKDKLFNVGLVFRPSYLMKWDDSTNSLPFTEMRAPKSWAAGVAIKPAEHFTAAFDLQYLDMSSIVVETEHNKDVYQPRIGLEYLIITKDQNIIPLRIGWFSNPQPDLNSSGGQTKGFGYSAGTGIVFKDFQIDAAYVHSERDPHTALQNGRILNKQDLDRFLISVIYRF